MNTLLLWLHFMGLAAAFAGGIGSAQVGPRLANAPEGERSLLQQFHRTFGVMTAAGFAVLLVSGPLLVWLKFGGFESMPPWFGAKMALVVLIILAVGGQQVAARSYRRGNAAALRHMMLFGRATGMLAVLTVLAAVLAFQ